MTVDHADFQALTVDRVEFQPLTVDYAHITEVYGRMRRDSTPSLVYGLTSVVVAGAIESMGVTPPWTALGTSGVLQAPFSELYTIVYYLFGGQYKVLILY